ncbi:MAG: alpha-amylase family glycosyl hydrolase [Anaerolineae bacterium]
MGKKALTITAVLLLCSLAPGGRPGLAQTDAGGGDLPWWNDRVFYEIFVRSFYDSDGDGIGDLQGVIEKLDYLNDGDPATTDDLGVTGIWLMPVAESPSYHGYDVADYRQVESDYGTNEDFRQLVEAAHARGIAVITDLVMNHTSSQHPWFIASRAGDPQYRHWYIWAQENPGYAGPFGQPAWHAANGQYYYGVFWSEMPDLNFNLPPVTDEMYDIARFWLEDMGVDGFRLDAVRYLIEEGRVQADTRSTINWLTRFDDHIDAINPDALTVGEILTSSLAVARYVEAGAVDMGFEFDLAGAMLSSAGAGDRLRLMRGQAQALRLFPTGQYAAFLTNHDQARVMTSLVGNAGAARVAAALLLTNPGVPFIYYGEEIGMTGSKPDECIRTPMQWDDAPPVAAFTAGTPCATLPAESYATANVAAQTGDPDSLLSHYRALIRLRAEHPALRRGDFLFVDSENTALYSFGKHTDEETLLVLVNLSDAPVTGYALSLAEGPLEGAARATLLMGAGDVAAPEVNAAGGFDAYTPLEELPPRSTTVILLGE